MLGIGKQVWCELDRTAGEWVGVYFMNMGAGHPAGFRVKWGLGRGGEEEDFFTEGTELDQELPQVLERTIKFMQEKFDFGTFINGLVARKLTPVAEDCIKAYLKWKEEPEEEPQGWEGDWDWEEDVG